MYFYVSLIKGVVNKLMVNDLSIMALYESVCSTKQQLINPALCMLTSSVHGSSV